MLKKHIKSIIFSNEKIKSLYLHIRVKKKHGLVKESTIYNYLEQADKVYLSYKPNLKVGLVVIDTDYSDLGYVSLRAYYPKFERFLKNNTIDYEYYNPFESNWLEESKKFDLIIWHTNSDPCTQEIAESKVYILEKLGVKCYPSFDELWSYEHKVRASYLYELYNLPAIPTFITHSKKEAIDYLNNTKFPIISKISTGSASKGVEKINNIQQGLQVVKQSFSDKGRPTYFKYQNQKNYVYFQEFIEDADYDLRIICINDEFFGYYRYPNKGDFRASGAGNYEKKEIPIEALNLAREVSIKFGTTSLATDLVFNKKLNKFLIIESSIFIGIDSCEQLSINGIAGKYVRNADGGYDFVKGKYWIQELVLKAYIEKNF